jgi:hypothetical protein
MSARERFVTALCAVREAVSGFDNIDTTKPRKALERLQKQLGGRVPAEIREAWRVVVSELASFAESETLSPEFADAVATVLKWVNDQIEQHRDVRPLAPVPQPARRSGPVESAATGVRTRSEPKAEAAAPTG